MKDDRMTELERMRDKLARQIANMDGPDVAKFTSKGMMQAEAGMAKLMAMLCDEAGENRNGVHAYAMEDVRQAYGMVLSAHSILTKAHATVLGAPIPRAGDR